VLNSAELKNPGRGAWVWFSSRHSGEEVERLKRVVP